jgi:hypothetical protein
MLDGKDPLLHWEFHRVEYAALRAEIDRHDKQRARLQYTTVGGSILITWSILRIGHDFPTVMVALLSLAPLLLLLSGWQISRTHVERAREVSGYILELERLYAYRRQGWQTYLGRLRAGKAAADFHGADPEPLEVQRPTPAPPAASGPAILLFAGMALIEAAVLAANVLHHAGGAALLR